MGLVKKTLAILSLAAAFTSNAAAQSDFDFNKIIETRVQEEYNLKEYTVLKSLEKVTKEDLVFKKDWIEFRQSFKDLTSKLKMEFQFEQINSSLLQEVIINYPDTNVLLRINTKTNIYGDFFFVNELTHKIHFGEPRETNFSVKLNYLIFEAGIRYTYREIPAIEFIINLDLSEYFR